MGKKISKQTSIQRQQRKNNLKKLEQERLKNEEKQRIKKENRLKRKKLFFKAGIISLCFIFCFVFIGGISLMIYTNKKQTRKVFWSGLLAVQYDQTWGYINKNGKTKIDFQFQYAFNFTKNNLALVCKNNRYGFINKKGEFVIDPIYENAISFNGEVAICKLNGKFGTIDKNGNIVTDFIYSNISEYNGNYAIAYKDDKYGIIDKKGNVVIDFMYEKIDAVNKSYFKYYYDNDVYLGFMDNGEKSEFFTEKFQSLVLLDNGYCIYKRKGLFGLLDNKKNIVLENKFEKLDYTKGDYLAYSTTGDLYGYVGFDGKVIIRERFAYASSFEKYAVVKYSGGDDTYYVINKKGKHIFSNTYEHTSDFYKNRAIFKEGSFYGVISSNGTVMVNADFRYISNFYQDGYAIILSQKNKYGVIRADGKVIIDPIYTNINFTEQENV